jgi:hypothetical protein
MMIENMLGQFKALSEWCKQRTAGLSESSSCLRRRRFRTELGDSDPGPARHGSSGFQPRAHCPSTHWHATDTLGDCQ